MAFTNGNLALQPKRKQDQQPTYREKRKVVIKRKTIPTQEKLLWMFTIVVCVIVAGTVIFRYTQIYQLNLQVKKLTSDYKAMQVEMEELEKQVQTLSSPENIQKKAKEYGAVPNSDENGITVRKSDRESASTAIKR